MDKAGWRLLIDNHLWTVLHDFNLMPLSYMDSSRWMELGLDQSFKDAVGICPEACNQCVLKALQLERAFEFNIEQHWLGIVLAESGLLQKVVRYCGLACWHPAIQGTVWQKPRQVLREAIGPQALDYALNVAPLLLTQWPDGLLYQGRVPESPEAILGEVDRSGLQILFSVLEGIGPALMRRLMLKFPVHYQIFFPRGGGQPEEQIGAIVCDRERLQLLVRKVTRVVEPQCSSLLN